jgi:hypothetical protein
MSPRALRKPRDDAAACPERPTAAGRADRSGLQDALCAACERRSSARVQFHWTIGADWTHEEGNHGYRRYIYQAGYTLFSPLFSSDAATQQQHVPNMTVFRSDNRSRYDGLSVHLQANVSRFSLVLNYTLSSAETWGCVLGELFDYVNGVCNPLHAFAKGDYGPSGENVTDRLVSSGTVHSRAASNSLS